MITKKLATDLVEGLSTVIQGKRDVLTLFVLSYLSGGHVLLEDVPGVGKTTIVKTLAALIQKNEESCLFQRIQCTPDLLPYDITGVDVFNATTQQFDFMQGPVFSDILLADELNRTPPKVQSALLQVMAEKQVTIGRTTYELSPLFFVAATQNPVETLGTYPLPAAQLDRFMVSLSIGYPNEEAELAILQRDPSNSILPTIKPVIQSDDILTSREEQKTVFIHSALEKAIISLCKKTRENPALELGASPRASLDLLKLAKSLALFNNRSWVEDTDLLFLAPPVLAHRCIIKDKSINTLSFIETLIKKTLSEIDKKTDWTKGS